MIEEGIAMECRKFGKSIGSQAKVGELYHKFDAFCGCGMELVGLTYWIGRILKKIVIHFYLMVHIRLILDTVKSRIVNER